MEVKLKKYHAVVVELSEHEARSIAEFLERMEEEGQTLGNDEVNELEIALNNQINHMGDG